MAEFPDYPVDDELPVISANPNEGFDHFADPEASGALTEVDIALMDDVLTEGAAIANFPFETRIREAQKTLEELSIYQDLGIINKAQYEKLNTRIRDAEESFDNVWAKVKRNVDRATDRQFKLFQQVRPYEAHTVRGEMNDYVVKKMDEYNRVLSRLTTKMESEKWKALQKEMDDLTDRLSKLDPVKDAAEIEQLEHEANDVQNEIRTEAASFEPFEIEGDAAMDSVLESILSESGAIDSSWIFDALKGIGRFTAKVSEMFIPETKLALIKFQTAIDVSQGAFVEYFTKMTVAEGWEEQALIWKEMREKVASGSEVTEQAIRDELMALNALIRGGATEAEVITAMAKYNAPSLRYFYSAMEDFGKFAPEGFLRWMLAPVLSYLYVLRGVAKGAAASAMAGLETYVGLETSIAFATGIEAAGIYAVGVVEFLLSGTGLFFMLLAQIGYYIARDGFTRKLADDLLSIIFMSLTGIQNTQQNLAMYPMESTPAKKQNNTKSNMLKLKSIDYAEMAITVDFWGQLFIDSLRREGHAYPEYRHMPTFQSEMIIPGKYINIHDHPNDSEFVFQTSQRIENEIASGNYNIEGVFRSGTEIDHLLPKRKGYIRNFASFPLYETSFHWPDYTNGEPIVRRGHFRPHELDPTIVATFKLWATTGKCGPIYNAAKDHATRERAAAAVRNDLKQWLEMDPGHPTAWLELKQWAGTNHGKLAATYPEMLILAPDTFNKEWTTDIDVKKGLWNFDSQRSIPGTDQYVYSLIQKIGRYPFTPGARQFYEDIALRGMYNYARGKATPFATVWTFAQRRATPDEVAQWKPVYQESVKLRASFDALSKKTKEEYRKISIQTIWPIYVRMEKPNRTLWSYIQHHRAYFLEELSFYCQYLNQNTRAKLWAKWIRARDNAEIPLNMNSAHRAYFMGQFAQLAYEPLPKGGDPTDPPILEQQLRKKFGGFDDQWLVTTREVHGHWAKEIDLAKIIFLKKEADIPVDWGDLMCRVIVLHEPRTLVLAFKGTETLLEVAIDADFGASYIGHLLKDTKYQQDKYAPPIEWLEQDTLVAPKEILHGEEYFQIHRGFQRATHAFAQKLTPIINKIKEKYQHGPKPIRTVNYCGHSLGAAMAQVAALLLPRFQYNQTINLHGFMNTKLPTLVQPNVYCISSPRVGDQRFTVTMRRFTNEVVHIWTDGDLVTAIPPMLYPAKNISAAARQEQWAEIKAIFSKDPEVGLIFIALERVLNAFSLPPILDPLEWAHLRDAHLETNASQVIARIVWGASQIQAYRADGTFFRVSPILGQQPEESNRDIGNTHNIARTFITAVGNQKLAYNLHSLENTLARFKYLVDSRDDIFSDVSKELPDWIHGGSVPQPKPPPGGSLPPEVQDALLGKNSRIIGTVHTMHQHPIYSEVPLDDVTPGSFQFNPFEIREIEEIFSRAQAAQQRTQQTNRNKRKHIEFHLHE